MTSTGAMVTSKHKLLPIVMLLPMVLLQLGFVMMSMSCVAMEGHRNQLNSNSKVMLNGATTHCSWNSCLCHLLVTAAEVLALPPLGHLALKV